MTDKPFRVQVYETRRYEFEVWAKDTADALNKGGVMWRDAPTVGEWETDATEYEYYADQINYEPHTKRPLPAPPEGDVP
jgi:hypothetical protein